MTPAELVRRGLRYRSELFLLLFGLWQYTIMAGYAHREIVSGPALGGDQVSYLFATYEAVLTGQAQGWLAGVKRLLDGAPAAGVGLQLLDYPVQLLAGIGRDSALAVNIAGFAFLPFLLVAVAGRGAARPLPFGFALFIAGFWVSIHSMYGTLGGPFDFRLDFAGLFLFALVFALAWRSAAFTRRGVCGLIALAVAGLACTRLIMFVHLVATGGIVLGLLLAWPGLRRRLSGGAGRWPPLVGLLATGVMAALAAAPILVLLWPRIWDYYFIGHVFGAEKDVRASMAGFHSQLETLGFYPHEFWFVHLGPIGAGMVTDLLALAGLAIAADRCCAGVVPWRSGAAPLARLREAPVAWALVLTVAALLGPYITLNLDLQKSWVVGNVFIVGVGALTGLAFLTVDTVLRRRLEPRLALAAATALGLLALYSGLKYQHQILSRPSEITERSADFKERERILAAISDVATREHLRDPYLFVDHIGELDGQQLELSHMERYGRALGLRRLLAQIFEVEPAVLWSSLREADFLILRARPVPTAGKFPIDLQMARLNSELHAFCGEHCRKLGEYYCFQMPLVLYARRP